MKKKLKRIILIVVVLFFFIGKNIYWYIYNDFNNVNIRIANDSYVKQPVKLVICWDDEKKYEKKLSPNERYQTISFRTSLGKHTLRLSSSEGIVTKNIFVLPIKFIAVEYYGILQSDSNNLFAITTASSFIRIE